MQGDWDIFNQHKNLARRGELNFKHFSTIYNKVNNDKNVCSGKIRRVQFLRELLVECQADVENAPPHIVQAFEDVIRP